MRPFRLASITTLCSLVFAAPAAAEVAHVVRPGESLWSIAAANNLTTRTVAVYNGLSEDAGVVVGATVRVPTVAEGYAALQRAGLVASAPADTTADAAGTATTTATASGAPGPMGAYTVRPGDTLWGLASQSGVSMADMAAMNGLDPDGILVAGTVLKLPTGAPAPSGASTPEPAAHVVPAADPAPTATRVSADQIRSVAIAHGVPASLAAAIGWQESGFNNAMVSSANARGVMQVMPGTWDWVQSSLADRPLNPESAEDNIHAGVLVLKNLLQATGDENTAIAAYYQGLGSVRERGLYDDTKQYVANVQALRSRFGGP